MKLSKLKPRKALNKAFLKVKPNRSEIERFKTNLIQLLDRTNDTESEEFHKNLVIDFLKKAYIYDCRGPRSGRPFGVAATNALKNLLSTQKYATYSHSHSLFYNSPF